MDAEGQLPGDLALELARAGVFRSTVPESIGGLETPVAELLAVIEEVARHHGSTGWWVMIGAVTGLLSGYLDPEDARVVYGTRSFGSNAAYSFWYVMGNKLIAFWASLLYNAWLSDVETCLKLAPTELWRNIEFKASGFGIEAEVTGGLLRRGERIYEVPISYKARSREEGKKITWLDGVDALWILLRIRLLGR